MFVGYHDRTVPLRDGRWLAAIDLDVSDGSRGRRTRVYGNPRSAAFATQAEARAYAPALFRWALARLS